MYTLILPQSVPTFPPENGDGRGPPLSTAEVYSELLVAHRFFNDRLFLGVLPDIIFSVFATARSLGHFAPNRDSLSVEYLLRGRGRASEWLTLDPGDDAEAIARASSTACGLREATTSTRSPGCSIE